MDKLSSLLPRLFKTPLLFFFGFLLLAGCGGPAVKQFPSPEQYDLTRPYKLNLPENLKEISGIEYYQKDTSLFAIVDEDGWLYKLYLKRNNLVQRWKFGKNHDYEDLQLIDSNFYVLSSNGDITRIQFFRAGDSLHIDNFKFPGNGHDEFESLYYDQPTKQLCLLCKDCKDDKKSEVSTWGFDPASGLYTLLPRKLDITAIAKLFDEDKIKFKASATAVHPITHELYVLSSVNKTLVIADTSGKVKSVYPLDPSLYKQPEGIAFTPQGDLLISNEVNLGEFATLLILKNKTLHK